MRGPNEDELPDDIDEDAIDAFRHEHHDDDFDALAEDEEEG